MKPVISRLSTQGTLTFFPFLLILRSKFRYYILLIFGLIILAGCFRKYYSTGTIGQPDLNTIERLRAANKFFILHYTDSAVALFNVSVKDNILRADKGYLAEEHRKGLNPSTGKGNVLKTRYSGSLLSEVHLYVNKRKSELTNSAELQTPLNDIYRVDIYEFDKKRTTSSTILSIVGIAAVVGLIAIIATSSGSSSSSGSDTATCGCPQVYVEQKGDFTFQNGIFSGAVYSNLERMDYLPLNTIQPGDPFIRLRVAGHNEEVQYLNYVQLVGVYHQPGTSILADREGKLFVAKDPQSCYLAKSQDEQDLKDILNTADGNSFAFNTIEGKEYYSNAYLTFKKPKESKTAKLIIRAKNSSWSARVNEEYTLLFGEDYYRYRKYQEKTSNKKMEALLLKQGLPIKVYVETGGKWQYAGYFPLNGTEGYREMIMGINLDGNSDEHIRVKLETVFNFWELDYAAIDYSDDASFQPVLLDPVSARHNQMGDQQSVLAIKDKKYVELKYNENIELEFQPLKPKDGSMISYLLASSGYYHQEKNYPVKANISRLKAFKQAGEFDRFSREKYIEVKQWQALAKKLNQDTGQKQSNN